MASDLEGLFLDIVKDAALISEVPNSKKAAYVEQLLKKKAEFLNNVVYLLRPFLFVEDFEKKSGLPLEQVFNMLVALGVDPTMYALKVNEKNEVTIERPTPSQKPPVAQKIAAEPQVSAPIGFFAVEGQRERDLPDHLRRSIGFGPQVIHEDEAPNRVKGQLRFQFSVQDKMVLVFDPVEKLQYLASLQILTASVLETDDKAMALSYQDGEWLVVFKNLANPEGKIGF